MGLLVDWDVNSGLGRLTMAAVRLRGWAGQSLFRRVLAAPAGALAWWWVALVIGADIPAAVKIGPRLRLPHGGRGVVVHPATVIGSDVTLYHRTTLGVRGTTDGAPRIGDGVYVGTGACVLGEIVIGDGAKVGANAVVIADVVPGQTYVGFPQRQHRS